MLELVGLREGGEYTLDQRKCWTKGTNWIKSIDDILALKLECCGLGQNYSVTNLERPGRGQK